MPNHPIFIMCLQPHCVSDDKHSDQNTYAPYGSFYMVCARIILQLFPDFERGVTLGAYTV